MDYRIEFSKRLIQLREQRGITQQELADKLKITRQSLSLYEKAERTINIELLARIADFFNVSTDYLMGRTDTATMNEDIQTACKITGLSEEAINKLLICCPELQNDIQLYTLYKRENQTKVRTLTCKEAIELHDDLGLELR